MINPCNNQSAIGNLVKVPELRTWASGTSYVDFTLGCNRPGEDAGTDFLRVRVKGKAAEALVKYGAVGRLIAVSGSHRQETVEHKGESFHVSHLETVAFKFLDKKREDVPAAAVADDAPWTEEAPVTKTVAKAPVKAETKNAPKAAAKKGKTVGFSDDEIPL
jgi:single-stranded DNA-binding protein